MYFIKFHFSPRVMKRQSSILRCFSQLSAKRREIGIDDELVSISPTNCAKEQESSVSGCNEDPGATNNTLSLELVGVSLPIYIVELVRCNTWIYMYFLTPIERPNHVSRHVALQLERAGKLLHHGRQHYQ